MHLTMTKCYSEQCDVLQHEWIHFIDTLLQADNCGCKECPGNLR